MVFELKVYLRKSSCHRLPINSRSAAKTSGNLFVQTSSCLSKKMLLSERKKSTLVLHFTSLRCTFPQKACFMKVLYAFSQPLGGKDIKMIFYIWHHVGQQPPGKGQAPERIVWPALKQIRELHQTQRTSFVFNVV